MRTWKNYIESHKETANLFKQILQNVPQDPNHHFEGDVFKHTKLVRGSINNAIQELKRLKSDPKIGPILANIDFSVSDQELQILYLSSWLHDIGKSTATTLKSPDGEVRNWSQNPWDADAVGKIQAIGHQDSNHYQPQIDKFKDVASPKTIQLYLQNKQLVDFIIDHHMDFTSGGFSREFLTNNFQGDVVNNTPEMKLLLILMWADKMGRKPEEVIAPSLQKNNDQLATSAERSRIRLANMSNKSVSFAGSPEDFVKKLQSKSKDNKMKALKGKYPNLTNDQIDKLTETFRNFFEASEMQPKPTIMKAQIPLGKDENNIQILSKALQQNDPDVHIYVVGGAVRDYLSHIQRQESGTNYKPKDIDLTTNLSEEEILERLQSPYATQQGISVKEKTSVDTFGVVFATVNKENYELAPFRKDVGGSDGRRPDSVERGTIYDDAMRRDLTINNLYYDFNKGEILDFNPGGQGIKDIQNKNVRCVGDPNERFAEDKLRILRMVRFFSRVNPGDMKNSLDAQHVAAIERFKSLQGITPERIEGELLAGIKQSLNTSGFLNSLADLDLMQRIFPNLQVDIQGINRLGNLKNEKVILAWLLRSNKNIQNSLNSLKYPNEISEPVQFLINAMQMSHENAHETIKKRDSRLLKGKVYGPKTLKNRYNVGPNGEKEPITYGQNNAILQPHEMEELNQETTQTTQQDLNDMARVSGDPNIANRLNHFGSYQAPSIDSSALIAQGLKGPEIGAMQRQQTNTHYHQSFQDYMNQRNAEKDKTEAF